MTTDKAAMPWFLSAIVSLLVAAVLQATSYRELSLEEMLDFDGPGGLVVVGEVIKVDVADITYDGVLHKGVPVAVISAREFLRGRGAAQVSIAALRDPASFNHKVGESAVWILHRLAKIDYYEANHPSRRVALADQGKVEAILAKRAVEVTVDLADYPKQIRVYIWNNWKSELRLQHPLDRRALSFFITDHLGNSVAPVGRAKVDPPVREITIAPGQRYAHTLEDFEFLTGSALFGFDLKPNSDYKVIATYRPDSRGDISVSSPEKSFTTK